MSNTIDKKVVEMQFDNAKFEKNVRTTMSTLDKLKASLKFDGLTKGFDDIEKSSGKIDFSGIGSALETVSVKFSAFEAIALGALARIGEKAVDVGVDLVKSLSVDQLAAGWQKYADKTQSVGTLIAQGYDMETVEDQLAKLNWYTDETSYEFTEMVANIAKFTAAGKDLPDSVKSLMGIANWAALSGQNAQTASRAMYQLSQAMGAGVMRKEDYKSIQNVSMDTIEFRERVLEAAVALGTLRKNADGTYTSIVKGAKSSTFTVAQFADHLTQEAWFTSDVMMKVYGDYGAAIDKLYARYEETGEAASQIIEELTEELRDELGPELAEFAIKAFKAAQEARTWEDAINSAKEAVASKWLQIYETIFGNYEEAKDLFTDLANKLYDAFVPPLDALNEKLQEGLRSFDTYKDKFISSTFGIGADLLGDYKKIGDGFGFISDAAKKWLQSNTDLDESNQNVLSHWMQMHSEATEAIVQNTAISSEKFTEQAALVLGLTKEQVRALREAGENNGYQFGQFSRELVNIYGQGAHGLHEMTAALIAVGDGLDQITSKDLDQYLTGTLRLTEEQVKELHRLSDEYGGTSEQVDAFLKSQNNLVGFGYANRGWTYKAIENLLDLSSAIGDVTEAQKEYKKDDIVSYIQAITGATQDEVETLWNLVNATTESEEAAQKNQERIDKWVKSISNGDEELGNLVLSLMEMEKQATLLSGRQNLITAFNNVWEGLGETLKTVKEAFLEVFPAPTAEQIYDFTERIKNLTEKLRLSDDQLEKLKRSFKGFFSIFKIIGQIAGAIYRPVKKLIDTVLGRSGDILDLTASWGDWVTKLAESGEVGKRVEQIFSSIVAVIERIIPYVKGFVTEFFDFNQIIDTYVANGGGLSGVFSVLADKIRSVIDLVIDLIAEFTGWDVSEIKENLVSFFDNIQAKIKKFLPDQEKITSGFEKLKEIATKVIKLLGFGDKKEDAKQVDTTTTAIDALATTVDKATPVLEKVKTVLKGLGSVFGNLFGTIKTWFESLSNSGALTGIPNFFSNLWEKIKAIDIGNIIELAKAGALIFVGWEVGTFFRRIKEIPEAISDLTYSFRRKNLTSVVKNFAIAIGILAASLYLVSKIDSAKLENSFWVITALVGEMIGVMELMNHTLKGSGSAKGLGMLKIALSLLLFSVTLEKIANIEKNLWPAVGVISIITTVLSGAVAAFGGIGAAGGSSGMIAGALSAIVFVLAIKGVAEVIAKLANIEGDIVKAAIVIGDLSLVITLCISVLSLVANNSNDIDPAVIIAFGGTMALLGAAILEIALAFMLVKSISDPDQLTAIAISLGGTLLAIGALSGIFASIKAFDGKKALAFAGAVDLLAVALVIVAGAFVVFSYGLSIFADDIAKFANISSEDFWNGVLRIASATAILGAALTIMAPGAVVVLALSAALLIASAAFGIIAASTVVFGIGLGKVASSMIMMSIAITTLGLAMKTGGETFMEGLGIMLTGFINLIPDIVEAISEFGVSIAESIVGKLPRIREVLKTLVAFGIGVICDAIISATTQIAKTVLTVILTVLDALLENAPEITEKLIVLLTEILGKLAEHSEEFIESVMLLIVGIINGIANRIPELVDAIVSLIQNLVESIIEAADKLNIEDIGNLLIAVLKIGAVVSALIVIGILSVAASVAVVAIASLLAEVVAILAIFGGISKIPGVLSIIESAGAIFEAIGKAIGKLVNGIVVSATENLDTIGSHLSDFMTNAEDFINGADDIPKELGSKIGELVTAIEKVSNANVKDTKISKFNTSLSNFGKALINYSTAIDGNIGSMVDTSDKVSTLMSAFTAVNDAPDSIEIQAFNETILLFASGISEYVTTVNGIDWSSEKIDQSIDVAKKLASLSEVVGSIDGYLSWIIGKSENDLELFGRKSKGFGEGISSYAESVAEANFNLPKIATSISVAYALAQLQGYIKPFDGYFSWIIGKSKNDLELFGSKSKGFGKGISSYAESVAEANFNLPKIATSISVAYALAQLQGYIKPFDGYFSWIIGKSENDLELFGNKSKGFGEGISSYAESVAEANFDLPKISTSIAVAYALSQLQGGLQPINGLIDIFTGYSDLGSFGTNLWSFGNGLSQFCSSISGTEFDLDKIDAAGNLAMKLGEMQGYLQPDGGLESIWKGDLMSGFSSGLKELGKGLVEFTTEANNIDLGGVIRAQAILPGLSELTSSVPVQADYSEFINNLGNLADGIKSFVTEISNVDSDAVSEAVAKINSLIDKIKTLTSIDSDGMQTSVANMHASGEAMASSLGEGFDSQMSGLRDKFYYVPFQLSESVDSAINENPGLFSTGIATGAEQMQATLESSMSEMTTLLANNSRELWGSIAKSAEGKRTELANSAQSIMYGTADAAKSEEVTSSFEEAGETAVESIKEGLENKQEELRDASEALSIFGADGAVDIQALLQWMTSGEASLDSYITGLSNGEENLKDMVSMIGSNAASSIGSEENYESFKSSGSYMIDGFREGIESKTQDARNAASSIGKAAAKALNRTLEINSPSKVGERSGGFFGEGFVNGVADFVDGASKTAAMMGSSAIKGLRDSISGAKSIEIDTDLTIRPVIDLTDVQNGVDQIYGMTRGLNGFAIAGSVDLASSAQAAMNRHDSDQPNESGLDKLTKAVEKLVDRTSRPNQTNHFNVSGADADEIVDKLMDRITTEFKREESEWD